MQKQKVITVTGIAKNAKAGAVVVIDSTKSMYYVDGVSYWDEKVYGKKIRVTGTLRIIDHRQDSAKKDLTQQMFGVMYILKNPKWTVVQ